MKQYKKSILLAAMLLLLIASGCSGNKNEPITASGIVEADEVAISSEIGGEILEIPVDEGEQVKKGEILVQFNDKLLLSQLKQAEAALEMAQANLTITQANTEMELITARKALDDLFRYVDVIRAEREQTVANARDAVKDAQRVVTNLKNGGRQVDISSADANVILLRKALEDAEEDFDKYGNKPAGNTTRALYQLQLAEAQRNYEDAVRLLNNLEGSANDIDLAIAEANLALAKARLTMAEDELADVQDGPDPEDVALARAHIQALEAQIPLAEAEVTSAEANYEAMKLQAEKLVLRAPISGVVLYRNLEVGEVALSSSTVLTLASLDTLNLTVYVPEDSYGRIKLGDTAIVTSDSFPDETFEASVTHIANEAEFTPRNVQTQEERKNTVFAIDLVMDGAGDKIKPGMPVDVEFPVDN